MARPWAQRWRFAPFIIGYAIARRRYRPVPGRVLFLSDSRESMSGNFAFLAEELGRDPVRTVHSVLHGRVKVRRPVREMVTLPRELAEAEAIVLDDYYPLVYSLVLRPSTRLVQVWHAAGAYKRVGFSRRGLPGGPFPGSNIHRGYTHAIASSELVRADIADAFGMDIDDVHALGIPRTDAFFDAEHLAKTRRDVRDRLGLSADVRVILFAPTFRGNGQVSAHYDYSLVDWQALSDGLEEGAVVLVKMHPFVRDPFPLAADPRFLDVGAEREINDLIMASDVLVTDYSSLIFETALLRLPCILFVPDLQEYVRARSFYHRFEEYSYGQIATTSTELVQAVCAPVVDEVRLTAFLERFMSACDGRSTERVVRQLLPAGPLP